MREKVYQIYQYFQDKPDVTLSEVKTVIEARRKINNLTSLGITNIHVKEIIRTVYKDKSVHEKSLRIINFNLSEIQFNL